MAEIRVCISRRYRLEARPSLAKEDSDKEVFSSVPSLIACSNMGLILHAKYAHWMETSLLTKPLLLKKLAMCFFQEWEPIRMKGCSMVSSFFNLSDAIVWPSPHAFLEITWLLASGCFHLTIAFASFFVTLRSHLQTAWPYPLRRPFLRHQTYFWAEGWCLSLHWSYWK